MKMFDIAERIETVMWRREEDVPNLDWFTAVIVPHDGRADRDVHAAVRDLAHHRLVGARHRAAHRRQDHPPDRQLHGPGRPASSCRSTQRERRRPISAFATIREAQPCPLHISNVRPKPDQRPGRHRRLRRQVQDHQQGGLRHRALLPDRHAGLRLRGAVLSRLHQAARARSSRAPSCRTARRCPARRSSSTRCRRRSTSAR